MIVVSVDDDVRSRDFARNVLQSQQYIVESFDNAVEAISYIRDNGADVALVDYKLPRGPDGLLLAKQIRVMRPECVIVMISAFAEREHIIEAMQAGADDFILKGKLNADQFIRRIGDAIMRRRTMFPALQSTFKRVGPLEIDTKGHTVKWYGEPLTLTVMEYSILSQLVSKPGHLFRHGELYFLCTGEHTDPKNARLKIKSHVTNLRQKLTQHGHYPQPIQNVYGTGFKWDTSGTNDDEAPEQGEAAV